MKFKKQSPLHVVLLCLILIFQFSCSKDSDLLTDYVLADSLDSKVIANLVVDDTYQVSLSGSMVLDVLANDTFENEAEVVISETSTPTNGTVEINTDETLTYTPSAEIIEQVSDTTNTTTAEVVDTFTYTAEVVNEDGTATSEEASVVITTADNVARQDAVVNISPWDYCQDGNPIGGGAGYDAIVTTGTHIVSTDIGWAAFKALVEARKSGDVVFINSNVTIDLTGLGATAILVPAGVTIASDRGNGGSEGAFLYTNQMKYGGTGSDRPVFLTAGADVRFTGFRMKGPFGEVGNYSPNLESGRRLKHGISSNYNNTEIDNCELYNFPASATGFGRYTSNSTFFGPLQYSDGHKVHHNYIHNNRQNGMGYGVATSHAHVEIYANLFQYHRHEIAGTGQPDDSYEAYCNTILPGGTHHNFDMHPEYYCDNDVYVYGYCDPPAGKTIYVHHNDFKEDGSARHDKTGNMANVIIGGLPAIPARIEYNRFFYSHLANWTNPAGEYDYAIRQGRTVAPLPKSITTLGNVFNGDTPPGQTGSIQN